MSRSSLFVGLFALVLTPGALLSQEKKLDDLREKRVQLFHQVKRELKEAPPPHERGKFPKDQAQAKHFRRALNKALETLEKIPLKSRTPNDAYYLVQLYDILEKKVPPDKLETITQLVRQIPLVNKKEIAYEALAKHALIVKKETNLAISYYEAALSLQLEPRVDSHYELFELYHHLGKETQSLKHLEAVVNHPASFSFPDITFKAGYYLASFYYREKKTKSIELYQRLYPLRHVGEKQEKIVLLSRLIEEASSKLDYKNLYFYYSELSELSEENHHREFFFIFGFLYNSQKWKGSSLLEELAFLGNNRSGEPRRAFIQAISHYYKNEMERAIGILKGILENRAWRIHALYAIWNILDAPNSTHEKDYYGILMLNDLFEKQLYDKAREIVPHLSTFEKHPQYDYYLGYVAKEAGESNKAAQHFLKYARSPFSHELALFAISTYFESIGDYSNAITVADKLVEIYPHSTQHLLYLAHLYREQKRYKMANQKLNKIIDLNPVHREALYYLGLNYYYLKDVSQTRKTFEQLIEYYPQTAAYYNFLGYFLAEEKMDLPQAKGLIEKALIFEPDNEAYLDSLAWVFYQLKDYELAKRYIEKGIRSMEKKNQKDAIIYHHAGDIYYALEEIEEAKNYWKRSLSLDSLTDEASEAIIRKLEQIQLLGRDKKEKSKIKK